MKLWSDFKSTLIEPSISVRLAHGLPPSRKLNQSSNHHLKRILQNLSFNKFCQLLLSFIFMIGTKSKNSVFSELNFQRKVERLLTLSITLMDLWKLKKDTQLICFQRVWFRWEMKSLGLIYSLDNETIKETLFMGIFQLTLGIVITFTLTNFLTRYFKRNWSLNLRWRIT